jgi:hypothetical protein
MNAPPVSFYREIAGADPASPSIAIINFGFGMVTVQAADDGRLGAMLDDPQAIHKRLFGTYKLRFPEIEDDQIPTIAVFKCDGGLLTLQASALRALGALSREIIGNQDGLLAGIELARAALSPRN